MRKINSEFYIKTTKYENYKDVIMPSFDSIYGIFVLLSELVYKTV